MLAKPTMVESVQDRLAGEWAEACPDYGKPNGAEDKINWSLGAPFQVTAPDPDALNLSASLTLKPTSCRNCVNFIPSNVVNDELGWTQGLCAATGQLLFPHRLTYTAKNCSYGVEGEPRDSTTGIHELPIYRTNIGMGVRVGSITNGKPGEFIEPTTREPDRAATDAEKSFGIRGWFKIFNPRGTGQYVELPLFDPNHFDAAHRDKIPRTGDDEHPEWYVDHDGLVYKLAAIWTGFDNTPALWGEAGVGKTELLRHMAWMMCLPFERISITSATELDSLEGRMVFVDNETRWEDGRIPKCWESACVFCLDEPNTGMNEVWEFIRPMTDNSKQLVVNDRRRARNPFCFFGLAMNPAWDPAYVGTKEISAADGSRLTHIKVERLPEDIEREVVIQKCQTNTPPYNPPADTVDRIMAITRTLREMITDGSLPINWNVREVAKVLQATQFFSIEEAFGLAICNSLEPETAMLILDQVRANV